MGQTQPSSLEDIILSALGRGLWAGVQRLAVRLGKEISSRPLAKIHAENALVLLKHRANFGTLFKEALISHDEVMLLSIMSQHTIRELHGLADNREVAVQRLRVLTVHPDIDTSIAIAIGRHLREKEFEKVDQIRGAWSAWKELERHGFVEVRGYRSVPMLQATVVGHRWMLVEFMPFGVQPSQRPALWLTESGTPQLFKQLLMALERMWDDAREVEN